MRKTNALLLALAVAALPHPAAALVISEVAYDPAGTDSGHEWIEVWNDGASAVDLAGWSVLEAGVMHRLAAYGADALVVEAGGYAVVADRPELFLADFPSARSAIDSAFSLSNTGEEVALVSPEGVQASSATWSSESGAKDGLTWQLSGAAWIAAAATPGAENADREAAPAATSSAAVSPSAPSVSAHSGTSGLSSVKPKREFSVDAGRARVVPVGATLEIEPRAEGEARVSYSWSWGDGASSKGKKGSHTYKFPGTYVVVLNARSSHGGASVSRTLATALAPDVALAPVPGGVRLASGGSGELNLGGFKIRTSAGEYEVPRDTILLPGAEVVLPQEWLGFAVGGGAGVELVRPDGKVAASG
jgi:hypothetical protein